MRAKICSIVGCGKKHKGYGLCDNHLQIAIRKGVVFEVGYARLCTVEGCNEKHRANGLCKKHHLQKWTSENKDKKILMDKQYNGKNKEKIRIRKSIKYHATKHLHLEERRLRGREYVKNNLAKVLARTRKYQASKLNATPSWANDFFIEEIYDLAKRRTKATGFKWHVDHIVPLKSNLVCGLHVEHNLQVIPAFDNISKGNRHWPDMP